MLTSTQLRNLSDEASDINQSPFMFVDTTILKDRALSFKELFPKIELNYALKCFPDPSVVEVLDGLIDGYDVSSINEIQSLIAQGIDPKRLSFSNPVKASQAIKSAGGLGVDKFAFQSVQELEKIASCSPKSGVYARINVSSAKGSLDFSSKFGVDPKDTLPLLLKARDLGLKPLGVTFHVGSQAQDVLAWKTAIAQAHELMREAQQAGITLPELNIGGGFPVNYHEDELSIVDLAKVINYELERVEQEFPGTRIIAEPGRFLTADCGAIVSTVIGKETRGTTPWLFLDTGTFQSFIEIFEFERFIYPVFSAKHITNNSASAKTQTYALTGPTCDSYDTMTTSIELPADIEVGDRLIITMTGAYTLAYGSNFNGFEKPELVFIESKHESPLLSSVSNKSAIRKTVQDASVL